MSKAIAFDTHRFVKNLTASGFTEAQAEALAGNPLRNDATCGTCISQRLTLESCRIVTN